MASIKRGKWQRQQPAPQPAPAPEPTPQAAPPTDGGNAALAQISKMAKSGDFGRVRAALTKAIAAGQLTEDQVSDAVDAALPSAKDAAELPLGHLLSIVTAASPQKQSEYAPILKSWMPAIQTAPENVRGPVLAHLQKLGF